MNNKKKEKGGYIDGGLIDGYLLQGHLGVKRKKSEKKWMNNNCFFIFDYIYYIGLVLIKIRRKMVEMDVSNWCLLF